MYGSSNTDSTIAYTMNSMKATFSAAAAALSEANRQLFNTSGVYGIIEILTTIAGLNPVMPAGSAGLYQVCAITKICPPTQWMLNTELLHP